MAYIDQAYYDDVFHGTNIPTEEFARLAEIASDTIDSVCCIAPSEEVSESAAFKKAVAYQTEMLYVQGGAGAITGFSESASSRDGESLGDYSVSAGSASSAEAAIPMYDGVPVSPLALMLLRKLGLMSRWAFAEYYANKGGL